MKRWGCLVVDPPWKFSNTASRAAAKNHYETMTLDEVRALPIDRLALPDAHCYLWTPAAFLFEALKMMDEQFGFTFKLPLVWVKTKSVETLATPRHLMWSGEEAEAKLQIGLGNYFRHAHEVCLFGTRGKAPARVRNLPSVIFAPRTRHSAKPEILQDFAEKLSPGPRLEIFARRERPNWTCVGHGVRRTIAGLLR